MVEKEYPLLFTMQLIDSLPDADTYKKLNVCNAHGNLQGAEGNEHKLALECKGGYFSLFKMPFGPPGALKYFHHSNQDIHIVGIWIESEVCLNQIVVCTNRGVDYEQAVVEILKILSKHNLWLKPENCEF